MVLPTNHLGHPYLEEGSAGGEQIFNELLNIQDVAIFGMTAIDKDLNEPPALPSETYTVTIDASAQTITVVSGGSGDLRDITGSDDGFDVSQIIQLTDTDSNLNDGFYTIVDVTATVITVQEQIASDETSTASVDVDGIIWTQGKAYIVFTSATNAWVNQDRNIAIYDNGWKFYPPKPGTTVFVQDESKYYRFTGTDWDAGGDVDNLVQSGLTPTAQEVQDISDRLDMLMDAMRAFGILAGTGG